MTDQEALQLIDDSPCRWTWVISGPLYSDGREWRWSCEVQGLSVDRDVMTFAPTRAEAIKMAHEQAMSEEAVKL